MIPVWQLPLCQLPMNKQKKFLLILWFWNYNIKRVDVDHRQTISTDKSEWASACLERSLPLGLPLQCMELSILVSKWSRMNLMVLEKLSVSKLRFFSPHFPSRTVYRSLLYVFKVAMRTKSKRFQTTHDLMQLLLASTQINNNRSLAFPILLRMVQSQMSCVYHLFSVIYVFLFFVVR